MQDTTTPRDFLGGRLRRMRPRDLSAFQAYRSLPELGRYQGWASISDAEAFAFLDEMQSATLFAPRHWVQLGIADADSDQLIGDIGLYLSEDGTSGEVGYTLQPAYQGRGIASFAVREALELLFSATSVTKVMGITDQRNLPSIKVLDRLGFEFVESRDVMFRDEPCRELVYVLTRNVRG